MCYVLYRGDPRKVLQLASKAADSLSWFDVTDSTLRSSGNWGLLPLQVRARPFRLCSHSVDHFVICHQAVLSCTIPAFHLHGSLPHMVSFPQWFGRNSKQGRLSRVLNELSLHTHTKSCASPLAVNQDYVPTLRQRLTVPLIDKVSSQYSGHLVCSLYSSASWDT